MIEKEVAEIRRRFQPDKNNITTIRGCYVNEKHEIISEIRQSFALLPENESEKMLAILKRTLSGSLEKNLLEVVFDTSQVVDSEEHRLLMTLKNSALEDDAAVQAFFQRAITSLVLEGSYLLLLTHDTYDIPFRSRDEETQEDASSEVFSYILCSICPIKSPKPALGYSLHEHAFHNCQTDRFVGPPELGFLFPAFDDRSTNIYSALYYSRDTTQNYAEFADAVFRQTLPMPPAAQKEAFQSILEDTLSDDCSYDVVQSVHGQLREMIEEHKVTKREDSLKISKETVKSVLEGCGVSELHVDAFDAKYSEEFGADTSLSPKNLVDVKQFEVRTPDVTIRVKPERGDLVETRMLDGVRYILIRANEGVEVNGVDVHIGSPL